VIQNKKTKYMKSKIILFGMVVAVIGIFTISETNAQTADAIGVSVIPTNRHDVIKVIYANGSNEAVELNFLDADGLIKHDKIDAQSFDKGFSKKYKVNRLPADAFWLEVKNPEMSVTYKVSNQDGKWLAEVEKTVTNRALASK